MLQAPQHYGNSRAIWDHTMLPVTRQRWHSQLYLSQLRLVLDLVTTEGCKAELTYLAWLHTKVIYQPEEGHPSQYVEQLRSCDERRYHSAKPPTKTMRHKAIMWRHDCHPQNWKYRTHPNVTTVEQGLTSHQTHYRWYWGRVLWVKRPNEQCQSTEGREVLRTRLQSH